MDRLEKALEKARQQRSVIGPNVISPQTRMVPQNPAHKVPEAFAQGMQHAAPTLAPIAVDEAQLEQHRILAYRTRSREADIFRILRTQVLQIMNKTNARTLAITSPNYGDGKTTIALNLAMSIALDLKQTVLLVDLDLRKPNLFEFMGMKPTIGLSNYLMHDTPIQECFVRPPFDRLNTLPAGPAIDHSSEVLGSPKMAALARELKGRYPDRMIIYDMPPVMAQDDSIAFLPHVDAVLMVVRDGATRVAEIKHCLDALANANVIGTILNNAKGRKPIG